MTKHAPAPRPFGRLLEGAVRWLVTGSTADERPGGFAAAAARREAGRDAYQRANVRPTACR